MYKGLPDYLAEEKMRPASELQEREQNRNNDLEWNPFGEDEMQESFEEYRLLIQFLYFQVLLFVLFTVCANVVLYDTVFVDGVILCLYVKGTLYIQFIKSSKTQIPAQTFWG